MSGNKVEALAWEHHLVIDGYQILLWPRSKPLPPIPGKAAQQQVSIKENEIGIHSTYNYWTSVGMGARPGTWRNMVSACMSSEPSSVQNLQTLIDEHSLDSGVNHWRMFNYRDPTGFATLFDFVIAGPYALVLPKLLVFLGSLRVVIERAKTHKTHGGELLERISNLYPYFCFRVVRCVGSLIAIDNWALHLRSETRAGLDNVYARNIVWEYHNDAPLLLGVLADLEGRDYSADGIVRSTYTDEFTKMPHIRLALFKIAAFSGTKTYSQSIEKMVPFSQHTWQDAGHDRVPLTTEYPAGELKQLLESAFANASIHIVRSVFWRLRTEVSSNSEVIGFLAKHAPGCDKVFFAAQLNTVLWQEDFALFGKLLVDEQVLTSEEVVSISAKTSRFGTDVKKPKPKRPTYVYLDWPTGLLHKQAAQSQKHGFKPTPLVSPHPGLKDIEAANKTFDAKFTALVAEKRPWYGPEFLTPWNVLIGSCKGYMRSEALPPSSVRCTWTCSSDDREEPMPANEPPCWKELTSLLMKNDADWVDHFQEAQTRLGINFWTIFEYVDLQECSLFDYAVLAPGGMITNLGAILSRLCNEKTRVDALILTGSMVWFVSPCCPRITPPTLLGLGEVRRHGRQISGEGQLPVEFSS
jgi:hypothetical protein